MIETGKKEESGKKKVKNSQGKDPRTFEENSQGADPKLQLKTQPGKEPKHF